jgi:hypothetical protein
MSHFSFCVGLHFNLQNLKQRGKCATVEKMQLTFYY